MMVTASSQRIRESGLKVECLHPTRPLVSARAGQPQDGSPLRLMIIAPLHYRRTGKSRLLYRKPAYLLTSDLTTSTQILIQADFDGWEIEVNHRDEKIVLGVGQAQVWARKAAPRVPRFPVAIYAMLLMASLMAVKCPGRHWQDSQLLPRSKDPIGSGGYPGCIE